MKSVIAIVLAALTAAGCDANRPPIQNAHPAGRAALVEISPECRRPSTMNYSACKKAAEILESDPQSATWIYANHWSHVEFGGKSPLSSGGSGGGGGIGDCGGGNCTVPDLGGGGGGGDGAAAAAVVCLVVGVVVIGAVVAAEAVHETRVRASHRITTRALKLVYQRSGDPWSEKMLEELADVRYENAGSYRRFVRAASE